MDIKEIPRIISEWMEALGPVGPWVFALLIILIGYGVAKLLEKAVRKILSRTSLDDRIASLLGQDADGCERGIAAFLFWLLMLFVIVFALSQAGQEETVEPLRNVYDQILGFVPRLLAAVAIGFIAWIVATVVKNLLIGVLNASRVDERLGLGETKPITNSVGLVAFFGILLMMLPNVLAALEMRAISEPISAMVGQIFDYGPRLFAAIVLFAIGYLVASIVQKVLLGILSSVGTDHLPSRLGYRGDGTIGGKTLSEIVSYLAMASILVVIGAQSLSLLEFDFITGLAAHFVPGFFNVLVALIIFAFAFFVANIVGQLVEDKSAFWARVVRVTIVIFFIAVALQKADISPLTNQIFQLVLTCLIIGAGFAAGVGGAIAIGLGGREKAKALLGKIRE